MYSISCRGQKFHLSARNYEWNLERTSNSSQSTRPVGRVYRTSAFLRITYYIFLTMFFIAYMLLKEIVHLFEGRVKVVSHLSCRSSAIFKIFLSPVMYHCIHGRKKLKASGTWKKQVKLNFCLHVSLFMCGSFNMFVVHQDIHTGFQVPINRKVGKK